MPRRIFISLVFFILLAGTAILAFQRRSFRFLYEQDNPAPVPPDANVKTEYTFARLRYPSVRSGGYWGFRGGWTTDYPKADRQGGPRLDSLFSYFGDQYGFSDGIGGCVGFECGRLYGHGNGEFDQCVQFPANGGC